MVTTNQAHPSRGVGIPSALGAALLFGASTPFVKLLLGESGANAGAALLYLGSGVGLSLLVLARRLGGDVLAPLPVAARGRFAAAIVAGGVLAPALLVWGLRTTVGSTASLLLNLEAVLTALLAWAVFRENMGRRIVAGLLLIVCGGAVLSVQWSDGVSVSWGALAIVGACACWALDNNLTQAASAADPMGLAAMKGVTAGAVNALLALLLHQAWPTSGAALASMALGLLGYGVSLVLFIVALRHLGAARTGAYFSVAPFIGAALSVPLLGDALEPRLLVAAALMGLGVWLHLSEQHAHEHAHEALEHEHAHVHDEHHQHAHDEGVSLQVPHTHLHRHQRLVHHHAHAPDLHHRHDHPS